MDQANLEGKVSELAEEVGALKARLRTVDNPKGFWPRVHFVISNWGFFSVLALLALLTYVKVMFDVDYLESYRDTYTKKNLSEFYRKLGDRLMVASEWEAAESSYREAVKLNPNNINATYGVAKAQVFQPLPGRKTIPPEIVDARLQYLSSALPNDANVYYLKALRYDQMGEIETSIMWLRECIRRDPLMAGCYLDLGYNYQEQYMLNEAEANFEKAIELDPSFTAARNNLGFCRLLLLQFGEAVKQLGTAYRTSPLMVTGINLGDAYRFSGDFNSARYWHQLVLKTVSQERDPDDRYAWGEWTYNFMPLRAGDLTTIKNYIHQFNLEEKKAVAHAALSIDLAALGDFQAAAREFDASLNLDGRPEFKTFINNKIRSTINLVSLTTKAKTWLEERLKALESQPK